MIIMASGTLVPAIARLVAADEDSVRDVIHAFSAKGLAALDPRWAGGRPRLISDGDVDVIFAAARTRPEKLGLPFTHWSLHKLAAYLAGRDRPVRIGRERLRQILHACGISFQPTSCWRAWRPTRPAPRPAARSASRCRWPSSIPCSCWPPVSAPRSSCVTCWAFPPGTPPRSSARPRNQ
jgi:transposase